LGIATSLNQFSRSIGQTLGVAAMGMVMTISLMAHLADIQRTSGRPPAEVEQVVHNPSALIDPIARAQLPVELFSAMAAALGGACVVDRPHPDFDARPVSALYHVARQ